MKTGSSEGYYGKILVMDTETTGLAFNSVDPSIYEDTGKYYQSVSWGLVVADVQTLKPIEDLYVEIQWDGKSDWQPKAEQVHKLSKQHLAERGLNDIEALATIVEFIKKHWPPDSEFSSERNVRCAGQNVATFDIWFMRRLFKKYNIPMFPTGNRYIDTSTIAWTVFDCYTSDQMFEILGLQRKTHHALEDAYIELDAIRQARALCRKLLGD